MSEQEQVESVLASIERPPFVTEIRHLLENDYSGDPAIRIWVILEDAVSDSEFFERSQAVRERIVKALRQAEIDRWPYLRFRSQSEQAELDREEAA